MVRIPGRRRLARLGRWLMLLVALGVAWGVWLGAARGLPPSDGTRVASDLYPASNWHGGVALSQILDPHSGGLRKDDKVVAVNGVRLATWVADHRGETFAAGEELKYTVARGDDQHEIVVTLHGYDWWAIVEQRGAILVVEVTLLLTASFVVARRPGDPAARALFALGVVLPFGFPFWPLRPEVLDLTRSPPMWPLVASGCVWALVWGALIPHFALVFPRPPPILARRRWIVPTMYLLPFVVYAVYLILTLPAARDPLERVERVAGVSLIPERAAPVVAIALMAWSFVRTTDPADRRRIGLVATSFVGILGLSFAWAQLPELLVHRTLVGYPYNVLIWVLFPLAIAVAVLRHSLFDITVVLRRSMVALSLAAAMTVAYTAGLWLAGGAPRAELPAFLLAALAAVSLLGVYRWLRTRVDRRIYGSRGNPYEVIELIDRIESTDDPEALLTPLARTLGLALRLPYVEITFTDEDRTLRGVHGVRTAEAFRLPLTRDGADIGSLEVAVEAGREPFGPADQRLLTGIVTHTASTLHTAKLNAGLRASQASLLTSREEERRRIRRDLHDGVGPNLALLAMSLEVAKETMSRDPAGTAELLDEAVARTHEAIADVRRTSSDLRPPVLDELGLIGAVRLLAERVTTAHRHTGVPLTLTVKTTGDLDQLPAAVEVAAYRIISEAVTNTSRHAAATNCAVRIDRGDMLRISVVDDGCGLSERTHRGTGLSSIIARATELGGNARIEDGQAAASGTAVLVSLPLGSPGAADGR